MTIKNYIYYPNRKLYSKDDADYVTLKDIVGAVRGGSKVNVQCYRTKLDITDKVLWRALTRVQTGDRMTAEMLLRDGVGSGAV